RLGIAENRGQRLLELVGEGAGELAEHRGARQVRELLALIARIGLGALAGRDVGARDDRAAFGATQPFEADFVPAGFAGAGFAAFQLSTVVGTIEHRAQRGQVVDGRAIALFGGARTALQIVLAGEDAIEARRGRAVDGVAPRAIDLDDRTAAVE